MSLFFFSVFCQGLVHDKPGIRERGREREKRGILLFMWCWYSPQSRVLDAHTTPDIGSQHEAAEKRPLEHRHFWLPDPELLPLLLCLKHLNFIQDPFLGGSYSGDLYCVRWASLKLASPESPFQVGQERDLCLRSGGRCQAQMVGGLSLSKSGGQACSCFTFASFPLWLLQCLGQMSATKGTSFSCRASRSGAMRTHDMGSSPSLRGPACPCPLPQYIRLPSPTSCPADFEAARQMQTTAHRDGLELSQLQKFQSLQQIQFHVYMEPLKGGSSATRSNPD